MIVTVVGGDSDSLLVITLRVLTDTDAAPLSLAVLVGLVFPFLLPSLSSLPTLSFSRSLS